MIFVTTGTIGLDEIIKKVDEMAPRLKDKVFVTIGRGKYIPKNCKWIRYTTPIKKYFKRANLVITQGGAGTLFECMLLKKRIIAIPQTQTGDQTDLVNKLSEKDFIIKCANLNELGKCIKYKGKVKRYYKPRCDIVAMIESFLIKGHVLL